MLEDNQKNAFARMKTGANMTAGPGLEHSVAVWHI